jgi:hypothetical protein
VDIFPIKRSNESLIKLHDDGVRGLITAMLNCLHLFDSVLQVAGILQNFAQQLGSFVEAGRQFREQVKKLRLTRDQTNHAAWAP